MMRRLSIAFGVIAVSLFVAELRADTHASDVPQLNSRPGAAYTVYLDFAGFNFTGTWGGDGSGAGTPGSTPAFDNVASTGGFNTTQQNDIREIWARVSQCYTAFNINVTTVDPAVAAAALNSGRIER